MTQIITNRGGCGGGSGPQGAVTDVLVDGVSVVDDKVAKIDLTGKQDLLTSDNAGTDISITNGTGGDETVTGNTAILLEDAIADGLNSVTVSGKTKQTYLPDGYTEYEYIHTSGKYFVTDYYPNNKTEVKTKIFLDGQPGSPLVTRWSTSPTNDTFGFYMGNVSNRLTFFYGTYSNSKYTNVEGVKTNMEHSIYMGVNSIVLDGTSYSTTRDTFTSTYPIYIGAFNQTSTSLAGTLTGRIYKVEFIENGNVIRRYIPCKNANNEIGLYETVTGTFISNEGTGTLKAGKIAEKSDTLPSEYTRLEYIQATGTQYIDSGVVGNFANNKIEQNAVVEYTTSNSDRELMGTNGYGFWGKSASNKIEAALGQTTVTDNALVKNNVSWTTDPDGNKLTLNVNSNQYTSIASSFVNADYAYYIFALGVRVGSGSSASFFCKAKVYSYTIALDDEVVCDLVPCKRNSDNVLGMYDLVDGTFKTNEGTGDFVAGNIVPLLENSLPIICNNGEIKVSPNLFRTTGTTTTQGGVTFTPQADGSVICTGRATAYYSYYLGRADFDPGTINKITVAINGTFNAAGNIVVDKFHVYSGSTSLGTISYTTWTNYLTVDIANDYPTADNIRVYLKRNSNTDTDAVIKPMAVKGTVNKAWKPYGQITMTGTVETVEDELGNTATAENLLSIGDYIDTQELISGIVNRKVGIIVLTGNESWSGNASNNYFSLAKSNITPAPIETSYAPLCTHLLGKNTYESEAGTIYFGTGYLNVNYNNEGGGASSSARINFNNWLKSQYANGTPVIVVYPLATATTETVTGQTLTTIQGDNTLTITQGSIDNLPIEANYDKIGGLTISFVNDSGYLTSSTGVTSVNGNHGAVTVNEPIVSATAPSSPTEGMIWYDTTNDELKTYDGNSWNTAGGGEESNTKTFYLSSSSDLTTAQAALDWYLSGNNPIIVCGNAAYMMYNYNSDRLIFASVSTGGRQYQNSCTETFFGVIMLEILQGTVTNIRIDESIIQRVLSTDLNYSTPYTPQYNGSPATKKYVDDSINGLGTAATKDTGTSSGNVPVLDSNGHLASSTIPGVALTDTFTVTTSSDLTSLSSADQGDIAIVTSENKTYVLSQAPYSTAANWKEILAPTGGVTSVNGQTGAVTLSIPTDTSDLTNGAGYLTSSTGVTTFNGNSGAITYTAPVTSVNNQTGAVTLDADDISDSTTTNKFVTASDKTTWGNKQDALTLPATPTQGNIVTWGASNKTLVDGGTPVVSGDSGTTYTIKVSNSDPASGTASNIITLVP